MPTRLRGIVSNRKAENHPDSRPISDAEAHSVVEDTGLDCHVPDDTAVGEQSDSMRHRQSEPMVHSTRMMGPKRGRTNHQRHLRAVLDRRSGVTAASVTDRTETTSVGTPHE